MLDDTFLEQRLEQRRTLGVGDMPPDQVPTEDINNYVEIEVGPFLESHQLGD